AGAGLADGSSEDSVDNGAVGVVDDADGIVGGCGRDVSGRGDLARGVDLVAGPVHVFVQVALVSERDAGGGNGAPEGRRRVHHGRGLLVGDGAVERALVDVVIHLASSPVDGYPK